MIFSQLAKFKVLKERVGDRSTRPTRVLFALFCLFFVGRCPKQEKYPLTYTTYNNLQTYKRPTTYIYIYIYT
nr:MAG TPA: hypothetical protein [Caudoviricetes sp.]